MHTKYGSERHSVLVDDITRDQWWQILKTFSDASIYQTWEYGDIRWGQPNLSRLVVRDDNGDIVAAAQARILKIPMVRAGIAYVAWGPMWQPRGKPRCVENLVHCLRALKEEYVVRRGLLLRLRPFGFEESDADVKQALLESGYALTDGASREQHRTILVNLEPSVEDLKRQLRKKWRYNLRQAEDRGLEIVERYDASLFRPFISLYDEILDTKKFQPGSSVDEFRRVQEQLPSDQRMRMTICQANGEAVAGSASSALGDSVVGLLAASGEKGRLVDASYLLQWDEILWSKQAGKRLLDLGGINPETNPGVYHFKSGLRGSEVTFLGVYDICASWLLHKATLALERAAHARKGALSKR